MFHEPLSPGMVIMEVGRDFDTRFDLFLGMRKWSAFLTRLRKEEEEEDKASNVFYFRYNTSGLVVEKNGRIEACMLISSIRTQELRTVTCRERHIWANHRATVPHGRCCHLLRPQEANSWIDGMVF